jgi:hypothetical protein
MSDHDERRRERLVDQLHEAMYAGDVEKLDELAPCNCCCAEHTFLNCPARIWGGCRGGALGDDPDAEEASWLRHYQTHHGLTEDEFYGAEIEPLRQVALDAMRVAPRCADCGTPVFDGGNGLVDPQSRGALCFDCNDRQVADRDDPPEPLVRVARDVIRAMAMENRS